MFISFILGQRFIFFFKLKHPTSVDFIVNSYFYLENVFYRNIWQWLPVQLKFYFNNLKHFQLAFSLFQLYGYIGVWY